MQLWQEIWKRAMFEMKEGGHHSKRLARKSRDSFNDAHRPNI